jgi:predicted dehydrogenase
MKFLIAGLGSIGRRHLRNLLALGERDILLYRTHSSTLPEEELAGFLVETDLEDALSHHPDAVIVSNPTALHLQVAIPAARAGCHLLLEKPVSHSRESIDELLNAVQRFGVQVLVGYQFRQHPGLQRVHRLLAEGKIGRVLSAHAHWGEYLPSWHPWEDYRQGYSARTELGGGVILTLSHPLDYLRWLLGNVETLWAFTGKQGELGLDVEDTAEIGLMFANSALGSLHLNYYQSPPIHYLEINGSHGSLRWDNSDGSVHLTLDKGTMDRYELESGFTRNDLFLAEMRHFIDVVNGEAQPVCSLEDGCQALDLALAALLSTRQGRLVRL